MPNRTSRQHKLSINKREEKLAMGSGEIHEK